MDGFLPHDDDRLPSHESRIEHLENRLEILNRANKALEADPRLELTVQDLEAALQWRTLMDPEQHSGFYYPHTAKAFESIISALATIEGES